MDKIYDADEIKEIRRKLAIEISNDQKAWQNSALQYLLSTLEELLDENQSLWFMLDEEKSSRMTGPELTKEFHDRDRSAISALDCFWQSS